MTARLPLCIPVSYTTAAGRYMLAYPRSPWDPRRYQVLTLDGRGTDGDVMCTVDDFGDLVPTHVRNPESAYGMGFKLAGGVQ